MEATVLKGWLRCDEILFLAKAYSYAYVSGVRIRFQAGAFGLMLAPVPASRSVNCLLTCFEYPSRRIQPEYVASVAELLKVCSRDTCCSKYAIMASSTGHSGRFGEVCFQSHAWHVRWDKCRMSMSAAPDDHPWWAQ